MSMLCASSTPICYCPPYLLALFQLPLFNYGFATISAKKERSNRTVNAA